MILKFCDACMTHVAKHTLVMPRNVVTKVQAGKHRTGLKTRTGTRRVHHRTHNYDLHSGRKGTGFFYKKFS